MGAKFLLKINCGIATVYLQYSKKDLELQGLWSGFAVFFYF